MWIVGDSFDYYANVTDLGRSVWDAISPGGFLDRTFTRFQSGQCYNVGGNADQLKKIMATNESTIYVALADIHPAALGSGSVDYCIELRDGATVQCVICFNGDGSITLRSGSKTGTVLATYAGAFLSNLWTHFQIRVVIDSAAGSFTVRKNGQSSDTFAATGLNTRGGTANNYANVVSVCGNFSSGLHYIDDLLFFSGSGAAPNTWVGDIRAICLLPVADTAQKQFTPFLPSVALYTPSVSGGTGANANNVYFSSAFSPVRAGPLTKAQVTFSGTPPAGQVQVGLYDAAGAAGAPGNLLAASALVTNPAGVVTDFAFSPSVPLSPLRQYYWALFTSCTSINYSGIGFQNSYVLARSFASGFPNPAPAMTVSNFIVPAITALSVGTNAGQLGEVLSNADTDYVYDATVGDEDLYDVDDLQVNPVAIVGVQSRIFVKKSDAGTRQGQLRVSSGGTDVGGTDTVLASSYTYLSRVDTVDPATGAPWTAAGVNAVKVGVKVTL